MTNIIPLINIPYEELKHLVIDCIKTSGSSFQFNNLCNTVGATAVHKKIVENPNPSGFQAIDFPLQTSDANKVREIIWDLIIERVLTIGDFHNQTWPWLSLTEYCKKALNSTLPVPNDPTGYLNRIQKEIPNLDPIIETYLTECIRTYNINQLLSATITLGCASEKALLNLIEVFGNTFKDDDKKNDFLKKTEGKIIKKQFDEFDKRIRPTINQLPYALKENYENTFNGVFQMIRNNRNNAGHPTGKQIDKDTLLANLQVFIPYCKFIYDFIDHLKATHTAKI